MLYPKLSKRILIPLLLYLGICTVFPLLRLKLNGLPHNRNGNLSTQTFTTVTIQPYTLNTSELGIPERTSFGKGRKLHGISTIGRLGNNLFQFAALYGITKHTSRIPVLDPGAYICKIFKNITVVFEKNDERNKIVWEKSSMIFTPALYQLPADEDAAMCCYFQSWKYFAGYEDGLRQVLTLQDDLIQRAQAELHGVTSIYMQNKHQSMKTESRDIVYVGVHVRRTDMASAQSNKRGYVSAPTSYIRHAMEYYKAAFPKSDIIFIMSSDDHKWCRDNFKHEISEKMTFLLTLHYPEADLALLSQCNHTIMTVGTFSWWAGWLAGGQVVYYNEWPKPDTEIASHFVHDDFFPRNWIPMT